MAIAEVSPTDVVRKRLVGGRADVTGATFEAALLVALLVSLGILITLLADVLIGGWSVLVGRGSDFLVSPLSSLPDRAGVRQGVVGSLLMMMFVVAAAFPVGIGTAIYLEEYAADTRFTRFVKVNIRNLAGVPSVVFGLLGVAVFVKALAPITGGRSVISGAMTLTVLVLPIVVITSSEALRAVPQTLREAAFGVGATRWDVIRSHVMPAASPGILTGTILSLSRALGETAPLLLVGAVTGFLATGDQGLVDQLRGPFTSLPTIVFAWARQPNPSFRELTSAAIVVLLVVILIANATAIVIRNRYQRDR